MAAIESPRELGSGSVPEFFRDREADALYGLLSHMHTVPTRAYHNLSHVYQCLDALDTLTSGTTPPEAVASIWIHDCVYVPGHTQNEEASAAVARAFAPMLRFNPASIEATANAILATKTHDPDATGVSALVIDSDLSILGASPEEYDTYAEAIRAEWRHVEDPAFNRGRLAFIQDMLSRPHIFATSEGGLRYERAARDNLEAEASRLQEILDGE